MFGRLSDTQREALEAAVEEFAASKLARQLETPEGAEGRCKPAALAVLGLLRERGLEAKLVRLDRPGEHHWVAVFGEVAVDPSARQFSAYRRATVPKVWALAVLRAEWDEEEVVNPADMWTMKCYDVAWVPPWSLARKGLPPRQASLDELWAAEE